MLTELVRTQPELRALFTVDAAPLIAAASGFLVMAFGPVTDADQRRQVAAVAELLVRLAISLVVTGPGAIPSADDDASRAALHSLFDPLLVPLAALRAGRVGPPMDTERDPRRRALPLRADPRRRGGRLRRLRDRRRPRRPAAHGGGSRATAARGSPPCWCSARSTTSAPADGTVVPQLLVRRGVPRRPPGVPATCSPIRVRLRRRAQRLRR